MSNKITSKANDTQRCACQQSATPSRLDLLIAQYNELLAAAEQAKAKWEDAALGLTDVAQESTLQEIAANQQEQAKETTLNDSTERILQAIDDIQIAEIEETDIDKMFN